MVSHLLDYWQSSIPDAVQGGLNNLALLKSGNHAQSFEVAGRLRILRSLLQGYFKRFQDPGGNTFWRYPKVLRSILKIDAFLEGGWRIGKEVDTLFRKKDNGPYSSFFKIAEIQGGKYA